MAEKATNLYPSCIGGVGLRALYNHIPSLFTMYLTIFFLLTPPICILKDGCQPPSCVNTEEAKKIFKLLHLLRHSEVIFKTNGMLVRTRIFERNRANCKHLQQMIGSLYCPAASNAHSKVVVMDAGYSKSSNG